MNGRTIQKTLLLAAACLMLTVFPGRGACEETYRFDRMWPMLNQPRYFLWPSGVTVDRTGNVFVADTWNDRIQKFSPDGRFIFKWGSPGDGPGQFNSPVDVAVAESGDIYVADQANDRIQRFGPDGAPVDLWGSEGGGPGQFSAPSGVDVDAAGCVYVADSYNDRIQKFDADGNFLRAWGSAGTADGMFDAPADLAVDGAGNVYVADNGNKRIQKLDSEGNFILSWGEEVDDSVQFEGIAGIEIDGSGTVYVSDNRGDQVLKFSAEGSFLGAWGQSGRGEGQLDSLSGISVDDSGNVYIAEYYNERVQKFSNDGVFLDRWSSAGQQAGYFWNPTGIARDAAGNVYVADAKNQRIQKFDATGNFLTQWGEKGTGDGQFTTPGGVAIDGDGNVHVVDTDNNCIQKFTPEGTFLKRYGDLNHAYGIAIDVDGNLLVTDSYDDRILKFSPNGDLLAEWGEYGQAPGQIAIPWGIAVDGTGNIYVVEKANNRVQKFDPAGNSLAVWGAEGTGEGEFQMPMGVAVDDSGAVYVADIFNHRIQKFTADGDFVTALGAFGSDPGQLDWPQFLCIDPAGKIYITDSGNNRVQVFRPAMPSDQNMKAVIVAGGGTFPGNHLWDATRMCAHFAYRTLTYQGFSKERIHFLSWDQHLDLDNNGLLDDVDGTPDASNLAVALTGWAADAEDVFLYLVDHGGEGTFRLGGEEILTAAELSAWLGQLQDAIPGKIIVVYDACESGSFLSALVPPAGRERIVVTSASTDQSAYFISHGTISFSAFFWTAIFNGADVKEAFDRAEDAISATTSFQQPLLDDNGNGLGSDDENGLLAAATFIGNGPVLQRAAPEIAAVSTDPAALNGAASARITAGGVSDAQGVSRVWCVIRPPEFNAGSADNPVQELPFIDLLPQGGGTYEGVYDGFTLEGTYHLSVYAQDREGNTSIPETVALTVGNPLRRRAVLVGGGSQNPGRPAVEQCLLHAYEALRFQGYADEDIYLLSATAFLSAVDGSATKTNLDFALNQWISAGTRELHVYLVGAVEPDLFHLSSTESITAAELDGRLDSLQDDIPGMVSVVVEGPQAGGFIRRLLPSAGKERILIASAAPDQAAYFLDDGSLSFSRYFWSRVLNGATFKEAFDHARTAAQFCFRDQTPQLDDNGNGAANEKWDGAIAARNTLGAGILLAGDDPLIGAVSPAQELVGETSAAIWAENVTCTGAIERVWAVVFPPAKHPQLPGQAVSGAFEIDLAYDPGSGRYEGVIDDVSCFGDYSISVFAVDVDGALSLPASTAVHQKAGPDVFETDDSPADAGPVIVDAAEAQHRNFHDDGDKDWIRFYAKAGEIYEIVTENLGDDCDTVVQVFDTDGVTPLTDLAQFGDNNGFGVGESIPWSCPTNGIYYIRITHADPSAFGPACRYDFRVNNTKADYPGLVYGRVVDAAGRGIAGGKVHSDLGGDAALTFTDGYFCMSLPAVTHSITADAPAFSQAVQTGINLTSTIHRVLNFALAGPAPGNVDGDAALTLADAISLLKIAARIDTAESVDISADVDGDSRLGLPEALYVIQHVADRR